jgi:4-amino-4-deoxy-L-arabinose transferase-like glycosyltransferase
MFTLALLSWYAWHETDEKWYLGLFYALSGLGTLAKGPVAVLLAVLVIGAFAWAKADSRLITRTLWPTGILIFCAVTLPWYIAVQWKNPEFFRVFLLEHNLARFSSDLYHHREPFWYYVPIALLALVPWTVFVLASAFEVCAAWWREKREMLRSQDAWNIFLIFWLIIPVLFFSISQSKLPGYILPAVPAGTLLLAEYVRRHEQEHERAPVALAILHSVVAMAPLVPAIMVSYILSQHRLPWFTGTTILFSLAAILAAGMAVTLCSRVGLNALRFVTLVPVVLTVTALLRIGAPVADSLYSARSLDHELSQLQSELPPVAVFQVRRETEYGLAFYRNQAIDRYDRGEIPAEAHLVVAPHGLQQRVAAKVPGRRVSYLGSFPPQNLDYFWVAMQGAGHQH